jgi:hypothetical protein
VNSNDDRTLRLLRQVDALTAVGGTTTARFDTIREGWRQAKALTLLDHDEHRAAILAAVLAGDGDAILAAYDGYALARARHDGRELVHRLDRQVADQLRAAYAPVAAANYAVVAAAFDAAAAELAKDVALVDPDRDPTTLLGASAAVRTAYAHVAAPAAALDDLLELLHLAATLAGANLSLPDLKAADECFALVVDRGEVPLRAAWQAWDSKGRVGRWSALVLAGCTIRAVPLEQAQPQRRARDLIQRGVPTGTGRWKLEMVDPEEEPENPPEELSEHDKLALRHQRRESGRPGGR